mmetsp:Transcript_20287/g.77658  ORF Transcript_20287/g.77658 Transcript_20287/m.77658 type:complete len:990 (+) Transcript_20287:129-3098(+)
MASEEPKPPQLPSLDLTEDVIVFEEEEKKSPRRKKERPLSPRAKRVLPWKGKSKAKGGGDESPSRLISFSSPSNAQLPEATATAASASAGSVTTNLDPSSAGYSFADGGLRRVKAATLSALVCHLTNPESCDLDFRDTFLLTYRAFTTATDLMKRLLDRFDSVGVVTTVNPIQLRVVGALKAWIEDHWAYDFEGATELQNLLIRFIHKLSGTFWGPRAVQLSTVIERLMTANVAPTIDASSLPDPMVPSVDLPRAGQHVFGWPLDVFQDVNPIEFARQQSLLDFEVYKQISPSELLGLNWSKKDKKDKAPNVYKFIQQFNVLSTWSAYQVVCKPKLQDRILVARWMVDLFDALFSMNNFSSAIAIRSGMNNAAVRRMKKTWEGMGHDYRERFSRLEDLTSSDANYKTYRETIASCDPPTIPHLGVYLRDLTFIEDGNSDHLSTGLINFAKCYKVGSVIATVQQYQKLGYVTMFQPLPKFQQSLMELEHPPVDYIYDRSRETEPKDPLLPAYEALLVKYDALYQKQASLSASRCSTGGMVDDDGVRLRRPPTPPRAAPTPPKGATGKALNRERRRKALHRRSRSAQRNVLDTVNLLLDSPASERRAAKQRKNDPTALQDPGKKHSSECLHHSPWSRASVSMERANASYRFTRLQQTGDAARATPAAKRRPATEIPMSSPALVRRRTDVVVRHGKDVLEVDGASDSLSSSPQDSERVTDSGYEEDQSSAFVDYAAEHAPPLPCIVLEPVSEEADIERQRRLSEKKAMQAREAEEAREKAEGTAPAASAASTSKAENCSDAAVASAVPETPSSGADADDGQDSPVEMGEEGGAVEAKERETKRETAEEATAEAEEDSLASRRGQGRAATLSGAVLEQSRDDLLAVRRDSAVAAEAAAEAATRAAEGRGSNADSESAGKSTAETLAAGYYSDDGYYDSPMEEAPVAEEQVVNDLQEEVSDLRSGWGARARLQQKRRTANFKHIRLQPTSHDLW